MASTAAREWRREQAHGHAAAIRSLVLLNGAMCPEAYRPRPIQRLLACAPVEAARLHKSSDGRQFTLVAVPQPRRGPRPAGGTLTQIQGHGRGEPRRRHGADIQQIGPYQIVIGKEVAQELVERAYGGLRHAGMDGVPAAGNLAG